MGKATIVGGGADGLYTIKIDAGAQQQASRVARVEQELATVADRIAEAETEYLDTTTRETYAAGALNAAIETYAAAVQANPLTASSKEVDRLTGEYYDAAKRAGQARTRLQDLMLQQRQLQADKAILASAPASETREAWCADLTEDAAGEVATIEVPGEPGAVLVAPGGRAPSAGDGALLARELMTPEQAFFNAAILPGWQKWMPTFRTGTITAINDDGTADVSLDAATSSAQGLGVNQTSSLSGVPVEYMECNAAAFEVGDACVVRFDGQSWDAPKVVGFVREPKPCLPDEYFYADFDFSRRVWTTEAQSELEWVIIGDAVYHDGVCKGYIGSGVTLLKGTHSIGDISIPLPNHTTNFILDNGGTVSGVLHYNGKTPSYFIGEYDQIKNVQIYNYGVNLGEVGLLQKNSFYFLGNYPAGYLEYMGLCLGPNPEYPVYHYNNEYMYGKIEYFSSFNEFELLMKKHFPTPPNFTKITKGKPVEYVFDGWGNKGAYIKTPSTPKASMQARYKPAKYAK